jgi:argininosuccinate lyase
MLENIIIKKDCVKDPKYIYMYSVEVVNNLVLQGMPFRDAYKKVGMDIENQAFKALEEIHHTHEGSIGNLMNESNQHNMSQLLEQFNFNKVDTAIQALLK